MSLPSAPSAAVKNGATPSIAPPTLSPLPSSPNRDLCHASSPDGKLHLAPDAVAPNAPLPSSTAAARPRGVSSSSKEELLSRLARYGWGTVVGLGAAEYEAERAGAIEGVEVGAAAGCGAEQSDGPAGAIEARAEKEEKKTGEEEERWVSRRGEDGRWRQGAARLPRVSHDRLALHPPPPAAPTSSATLGGGVQPGLRAALPLTSLPLGLHASDGEIGGAPTSALTTTDEPPCPMVSPRS